MDLLVLAGWATLVSLLFRDLSHLAGAFDPFLLLLQILSFVAFIGGLGVFIWYLVQVWRGRRSWWARVWSVLLVLAGVVVVWVGLAFHLIDFGTNY